MLYPVGQGPNETIPEAEAMKAYLVAHGISAEDILVEDKSTNTLENFQFSKEILDQVFQGQSYRVAYVTSDFNVFRAGVFAKSQGLTAYGIAAKDVWYLSLTDHIREFISVTYHFVFYSNFHLN